MDHTVTALIIVTIANLIAISCAWHLRLNKSLPILFLFLCFELFQNAAALVLGWDSVLYRRFWLITEPLNSVLYVFMLWEVYRRVFVEYPGFVKVAKMAAQVCLGGALVVCAVMVISTPPHEITPRTVTSYALFWEECVAFTLTVFILFMVFMLFRYPLDLDPKVGAHIAVFTFYLAVEAIFLAIVPSETSRLVVVRDYGVLVLQVVSFLGWGVLLSRASSISIVRKRSPADEGEAQRLLTELQGLNTMLARSVYR